MKNQFLNLGKALNKAEQRSVNGGGPPGGYPSLEICEVYCTSRNVHCIFESTGYWCVPMPDL